MCGIVGAAADRNVVPILIEGLRRLEYRGYDSAGVAVVNSEGQLSRVRSKGKVAALAEQTENKLAGNIGIAHTRWATHGEPSETNAHPHRVRSSPRQSSGSGPAHWRYARRPRCVLPVSTSAQAGTSYEPS